MRSQVLGKARAAAIALVVLPLTACEWVGKTVECAELTRVSNHWSQQADVFGKGLESDVQKKLGSLDSIDYTSAASLRRAARDMRDASDHLDTRVDGFFGQMNGAFRQISLSDPQLIQLRDLYVTQVDDVGARIHDLTDSVRHLGGLMDGIDSARIRNELQARTIEIQMANAEKRITEAERGLEQSTLAEEQLIERINAYCQPLVPPRKLADTDGAQPTGTGAGRSGGSIL